MTAYCISLMFLAGLSVGDIKERKISIHYVLIFALSAVFFQLLTGEFFWKNILWGIFPGSMLLLLGFLTKEAIGYGDGMCVLALGLWTGGWFTLIAVCIGTMLAGIWGIICIFRRKRESIPFVPFLLLGMEVVLAYA